MQNASIIRKWPSNPSKTLRDRIINVSHTNCSICKMKSEKWKVNLKKCVKVELKTALINVFKFVGETFFSDLFQMLLSFERF